MKSLALGVVVVRVQVPELHDGHRYLLDAVTGIHEHVLVVIGDSETRLTPDDPLTFDMRKQMILSAYPKVMIYPLADQPSDYVWSEHLDALIEFHGINLSAPAVLYGGRDSFLKHYHGKNRTFELPPAHPMSGTDERAKVVAEDSAAFRRGMIYAARYRYPTSYQCVDVGMFRIIDGKKHLLLGQKKRDEGKWRLIGGFVSPGDVSLEAAASRELREETTLEAGFLAYMGSTQVDDYRYPKSGSDRLMTAVFLTEFTYGTAEAKDDLDAVRWFPWDSHLVEMIVREHVPMYNLLLRGANV